MLRKELKKYDVFEYQAAPGTYHFVEENHKDNPLACRFGLSCPTDKCLNYPVKLMWRPRPETRPVVPVVPDPINPPHYQNLTPEPIDVIDSWGLSKDYYLASALAYI